MCLTPTSISNIGLVECRNCWKSQAQKVTALIENQSAKKGFWAGSFFDLICLLELS
jgi:hypothetical protein